MKMEPITTQLHTEIQRKDTQALRSLLGRLPNSQAANAACEGLFPLNRAIICGSLPIVRLLIEHGAAINATDKDGLTALHHAAMNEHSTDIIEFLVSHGANVNARTQRGSTPLDIAISCRSSTAQLSLLNAGGKTSLDNRKHSHDRPLS